VSLLKLVEKIAKSNEVTDHHLTFIGHFLLTDFKIPCVKLEVFNADKLILVRAYAESGGVEYFIKPKKDPFKDLAMFLELDYTIRFRSRDD